ncbi:hypothetical protein [Jeongeupia naejangsanensis]|uniref:Uncharacterized protein n=1 Tax=Jeongeupia naejangsanensis TaxID=613195 RepID=A0ABS2BG41_9NEIS|nr:hypothetical protein [Jeongeupia naejangsanensis]MBM3114430.1 hypothetical protein [Jeongeupia naejangsanensis]
MSDTIAVGIGAVAMFLVGKWVMAQLARKGVRRWVQYAAGGAAAIVVLALVVGVLAPNRVPALPHVEASASG